VCYVTDVTEILITVEPLDIALQIGSVLGEVTRSVYPVIPKIDSYRQLFPKPPGISMPKFYRSVANADT